MHYLFYCFAVSVIVCVLLNCSGESGVVCIENCKRTSKYKMLSIMKKCIAPTNKIIKILKKKASKWFTMLYKSIFELQL